MNWYYAEGGKQQGPVVDTEFDALIRAGKIRPDTLVWREGLTGWKQLREVMPEAAAAAATPFIPTPGMLQCGECGQEFAPDQVVRINDQWICAACKPIRLQRLMEGSAPTPVIDGSGGTVSIEDVRERDYEHDIGWYLSEAWRLFKSDPGPLIGAFVVTYICTMVAGSIPFGIGFVVQLVVTGPLWGGLGIYYLKKYRGESPAFGDVFSGFGPRSKQLILGGVVSTLLEYLPMLPAAIVFGVFIAMGAASGAGNVIDQMGPALIGTMGVLALCGLAVTIYLTVCWIYSLGLIMDKGMNFWPAMGLSRHVVRKHWWMTFLILILGSLMMFGGVLLCCVGVLVAGPVAFGMGVVSYQRLFGDMTPTER